MGTNSHCYVEMVLPSDLRGNSSLEKRTKLTKKKEEEAAANFSFNHARYLNDGGIPP